MSRLDEIKKLNERGEILIEATTEDAAAFSWLIERVEHLERENEHLRGEVAGQKGEK